MSRILLVTDIFPPDIGGPATFIPKLADSLTRDQHAVKVLCTSELPSFPSDSQYAFSLVRLPRERAQWDRAIQFRWKFLRAVAEAQLVFVNGLEVSAARACRALRKPYLLKIVGDSLWETARNLGETTLSIDEFQKCRPSIPLFRAALRRAHRIITPSDYLRKMVIGWDVPGEKIITIPNGVELPQQIHSTLKRKPGESLRVVFAGRLVNWKGVALLLQATRGIESIEIQIVGDGPEKLPLEKLTQELGLSSQVKFIGTQDKEKLREVYRTSHLVTLPSSYEGLSHTLLEAGLEGLPCLASNVGGNLEVLRHGIDGFLISPSDVGQWREKLLFFNTHEEERLKFGRNLQTRILDKFRIENSFAKIKDLLEI